MYIWQWHSYLVLKDTHKIRSLILNRCSYRTKPVGALIFETYETLVWRPRGTSNWSVFLVAIATASFEACFVNVANKYRNNKLKVFKCIYNIWTVFWLPCFISVHTLLIPKRNSNLKNFKPKILTSFFHYNLYFKYRGELFITARNGQ